MSSSGSNTPFLLLVLAAASGWSAGATARPNIRTPHLDRLAREGVRLTDYYANGPTCSPTRYAFMTGRYQQRGGLEYALLYQEMGAGLPPGGETLATRLRQAGYATALIGKWHLGYDRSRTPNEQGFDYFFGLLGGNHHYLTHVDRTGVPDLFLNGQPVERKGYSTDLFTDDALRCLREVRDRPFFLFLAYNAPHLPYQGPGDAAREVKPNEKSWGEGTRANYVSMVERLDDGIGRVPAELEQQGVASNGEGIRDLSRDRHDLAGEIEPLEDDRSRVCRQDRFAGRAVAGAALGRRHAGDH